MDGGRGRSTDLSGLGLFLGLALVASTWVMAHTLREIKSQNQSIEVKGYAEKRLTSDWSTWTGRFTTRGIDLASAYTTLERQRGQVVAFLRAQAVPDSAVELAPVITNVRYEMTERGVRTNKIVGYELYQQVKLSSGDIDLVARVAKASAGLIKEGIEFSGDSPQYFYTRLDDLKIEMLGAATADARQRAQELADNSGSHIGTLRGARQGVFQITPAHSTEVSDYGANDTSSRDKTIKAVVTIRYSID